MPKNAPRNAASNKVGASTADRESTADPSAFRGTWPRGCGMWRVQLDPICSPAYPHGIGLPASEQAEVVNEIVPRYQDVPRCDDSMYFNVTSAKFRGNCKTLKWCFSGNCFMTLAEKSFPTQGLGYTSEVKQSEHQQKSFKIQKNIC